MPSPSRIAAFVRLFLLLNHRTPTGKEIARHFRTKPTPTARRAPSLKVFRG